MHVSVPAGDRRRYESPRLRSASRRPWSVPSRPEDFDVVRGEVRIRGHDGESLELSLSDQQAIERIVVMYREVGDPQRVLVRDREDTVCD